MMSNELTWGTLKKDGTPKADNNNTLTALRRWGVVAYLPLGTTAANWYEQPLQVSIPERPDLRGPISAESLTYLRDEILRRFAFRPSEQALETALTWAANDWRMRFSMWAQKATFELPDAVIREVAATPLYGPVTAG